MKLVKIKLSSLTRLGNMAFMGKAGTILTQFQTHMDVFPAPPVTTAQLDAAIDDLASKTIIAAGDDGSHNLRNARDLQRSVVLNMLFQNSAYVLGIASAKETTEEQIAIVELAGYDVANETSNPVVLTPVEGLTVQTTGMPGVSTVTLRWKRGNGIAFIIQTTQGNTADPATVWTDAAVSTRSKYDLTLSPGTWAIRVIAVASSEQSVPCQPVQVVVG